MGQIVKKGSGQMALTEMSRKIFLGCRSRQITLIVNWESREAEVMKEVDSGSRCPWLLEDEFQLDFDSYAQIMTRLLFPLKVGLKWFYFSYGLIFGHLFADLFFLGLYSIILASQRAYTCVLCQN